MRHLFWIFIFFACTKQDATNTMTGVWLRDNGTTYSFFDDSRFQQSDQPGKQWVWEKKGTRVFLYGTPDRVWTVDFIGADEVEVIETDTFIITRQ